MTVVDNRPRIVGTDVWNGLTDARRETIGARAIELVAAWHGEETIDDPVAVRPFEAAASLLTMLLEDAVLEAVPAIEHSTPPLLPSELGGVCRRCGCSQDDGCETGCGWAEKDLCTACVSPPAARPPGCMTEDGP